MERVAIFPGSFDPFTRGHEAIVEEALHLFDRVVIAIGYNIAKRGFLPSAERKRLIEELYAADPRVEVTLFTTLMGEEARRVGAGYVIRSARNAADFEYERTMERANRDIFPELKTVMLLPPPEVENISSSLVRELHAFGYDVTRYMPEGVTIEKYLNR